jgi:carbon-monoxide dehydrogenase small subunit
MPEIAFTLNGRQTNLDVLPDELLADVLREKLGLIGVKVGCGEGECGACTVLVDGEAVLSCIYPVLKVQGRQVITIEGLSQDRQLHVIQQAFVDCTASQCGYCTPGMIMAAKALLDQNANPTRQEIASGISGNLCRCTGYYQIIDAIELAAQRLREDGT